MLDQNKFRYKFIPLPPMRKNPISVYSGGYPTSTSLADFKHIQYPFRTLQTVTSHIYPHYVVYDVGKKLEHFFGKNLSYPLLPDMSYDTWIDELDMGSAVFGVLNDCHTLYSRWMAIQPPPSFLGKGPDIQKSDENEDGESGNSNKRWRGPSDGRRSLSSKKRSRTDGSGGRSDIVLGSPGNIGSQRAFNNALTPFDSVSCHNLLQYDDSDVGNTVGVGDKNDDINSEASISSLSFSMGIETWRQSVWVAGVEGHVQKQVEDTNAEDECAVGRGAASLPSTKNSAPSITMVDVGATIGPKDMVIVEVS
jgi:hypothetical protein